MEQGFYRNSCRPKGSRPNRGTSIQKRYALVSAPLDKLQNEVSDTVAAITTT
jgi:hypothetical protein